MSKLNFIDIFCGAGGFSSGLELAGYKCLLGIDHDKNAIQTFECNHKHAKSYCGDIIKLSNPMILDLLKTSPLKTAKIDLIVGGPPCQGFSTVGKGNPDDIRNRLFLEYFRIVKLLKPKIIIIENVTGLLAKKNEQTLHLIFKKFESIGYKIDCKVLSAEKYGVPSRRRRTIIIGNCLGVKNIFPKELATRITVGEALKYVNSKLTNHKLDSSKISNELDLKRIKFIPQGKGIRYKEDEESYLPKKLRFNVNWNELKENRFRQTKYQRLDRKQVAPTILTHRHCYYHPSQNRYLTIREAARLQSFLDDFIFTGSISSQWRQVGNAVPPKLAYHLGKSISKMIKQNKSITNVNIEKKQTSHFEKYVSEIKEKAFSYK